MTVRVDFPWHLLLQRKFNLHLLDARLPGSDAQTRAVGCLQTPHPRSVLTEAPSLLLQVPMAPGARNAHLSGEDPVGAPGANLPVRISPREAPATLGAQEALGEAAVRVLPPSACPRASLLRLQNGASMANLVGSPQG